MKYAYVGHTTYAGAGYGGDPAGEKHATPYAPPTGGTE